MIRHWHRTAEEKRQQIVAKRLERGVHHLGTYPHWSRFQSRDKTISNVVDHIIRPKAAHIPRESVMTACGFNLESFRAAGAFHVARQGINPCPPSIRMFASMAPRITCPHCYSVLDDVATWLAIANEDDHNAYNTFSIHATHCSFGEMTVPLCGYTKDAIVDIRPTTEFMDFPPSDNCALCSVIYQRLYGDKAPEYGWEKYESIEQATRKNQ
jgi:hypothetical protein